MNRTVNTVTALLAAAAILGAGGAQAQAWPAKPIKVVIPFVAGGSSAVTAKARHPQLPNVPTVAEAGLPDLVVTSWQAAAAPAKTPREIVVRLNDAMVKALRSPEIRERMTQIGFDVVAGTPEEFGRFMKEEVDRWTTVVNKGGIKPD